MTELENRAATMPCPECGGDGCYIGETGPVNCQSCGTTLKIGTGLRWPLLSRECRGIQESWPNGVINHFYCFEHDGYCHGSGRVPDVTLEKVLPLLNDVGGKHVIHLWLGIGGLWFVRLTTSDTHHSGDNPLEAALAALLASVEAS